jgi:hypothetical protein
MMRELFDKEFQQEMDDFFDYIDGIIGRDEDEVDVITDHLPDPMTDEEVEEVSDCCGADVYEDYDICSNCNDHCGREESEQ